MYCLAAWFAPWPLAFDNCLSLAAGDISRQLLDGDGFARVQQVVHLAQGVLAIVVHSILRLRLAVLIDVLILIRRC